MPITLKDIRSLIRLLGSEGAVAGLLKSSLENEQLRALVREAKIDTRDVITREAQVEVLVASLVKRDLKPLEELIKMTYDELIAHFSDVSPTNGELIKVMTELGYKVSAEDRKHLRKSVARQLSETALFANVALQIRNQPKN